MKFFCEVGEGERFPSGYGLCWFDACRMRKVACPVPLNWLVSWARDAYFFLMRPKPAWSDEFLREEFFSIRDRLEQEAVAEVISRLKPTSGEWAVDGPLKDAIVYVLTRSKRPNHDLAMARINLEGYVHKAGAE